MTLRQLLAELELHTATGTGVDEQVLILVGRELRHLDSTYQDHAYILVAGPVAQ